MSAFTSIVIGTIAGILIGLALPALRDNHEAERFEAVRELVTSYQRKAVEQGGQLRECTQRLETLKSVSIFDALSGGAKP